MNAGSLDRRIRIEVRSSTQEAAFGTRVNTWTEFASRHARVIDVLPGRGESMVAGTVKAGQRVYRIRLRWLSGLTADMRVKICPHGYVGGSDWWTATQPCKIVSGPAEIGRRAWMEITAMEYTPEGAGA